MFDHLVNSIYLFLSLTRADVPAETGSTAEKRLLSFYVFAKVKSVVLLLKINVGQLHFRPLGFPFYSASASSVERQHS